MTKNTHIAILNTICFALIAFVKAMFFHNVIQMDIIT
jgi:hypothetical protein